MGEHATTTLGAPTSVRQEPGTDEECHKRLSFQEELFVFSSLMLITCYFLPWRENETPWDMLLESGSGVSSLFLVGLFILYCLTPWSVLSPRARPWFGIIVTLATGFELLMYGGLAGQNAYGAQLTKLFALAVLVLSADEGLQKAGDFAMRRLNARAAEVMTHWGTVVSGIHFSAQELYGRIEAEVRERKWPGVEFLRVLHSEAGMLSHKREYLRVIRQRQVFDFCAATFGKDYFFTLREAEIKPQVTLTTLIIFLMVVGAVFLTSVSFLGLFSGALCFAIVLVATLILLLNILRMGLTRLDGILMRLPVIGPIYETWFRHSTTYFQHDARMVFLKLMDDLVKEHVDEETSAKGIKLLSGFEHQPIFDGLYKTFTRKPKGDEAK